MEDSPDEVNSTEIAEKKYSKLKNTVRLCENIREET